VGEYLGDIPFPADRGVSRCNCGFQSSHEELQNNLCAFMNGTAQAGSLGKLGTEEGVGRRERCVEGGMCEAVSR